MTSEEKRTLKNKRISNSLKGRVIHNEARYRIIARKSSETRKRNHLLKSFEELGRHGKRVRIFLEQDEKCLFCRLGTWNGLPIVLELDHVDGDKLNNTRKNLRLLCPNCHSQTPTWRRQKQAVVVQQIE